MKASGEVKVWDATSGQESLTLKWNTKYVRSVAFSADGNRLASASDDGTVKVWDATSGQETLTLKGHTNTVWSVAFSPDGNRLASASNDQTIRVWDATSVQPPPALKAAIRQVGISPPTRQPASANQPTSGAAPESNPDAEKAALEAAQAWLKLIDAGKYAEGWEECAALARDADPKEDMVIIYESFRRPLGKVLSREVQSRTYTTTLPGAPQGEYVLIQMKTDFESKKGVIETVMPMLDKDGKWRVSGYYIKPASNPDAEKAAIECAEAWLELVDAGMFAESWDEAAGLVKSAVSKAEWEESMPGVRASLGKVESRQLAGQQYTTSLPGAPEGEYVMIQYKTTFENKKDAVEEITPTLAKDGKWRVSGYHIK